MNLQLAGLEVIENTTVSVNKTFCPDPTHTDLC